MFALPNLSIAEPINVDGFAVVPPSDERVVAMVRAQRRLGTFLKTFKTEFGDPITPALIIWRDDMPNTYRTIAAISGFRDAIALSVVPIAWARALRWENNHGAMYSDYFAVYPWMVDKEGKDLITSTPATLGVHQVSNLRGQSTAALSPYYVRSNDIDAPLLRDLLHRWERCFATDSPNAEDRRVFRSLNMANAAAKLPAGADTDLYDTLRSVALWASAFEILKPVKNQAYKQTYKLLEGIKWNLSHCNQAKYLCFGDDAATKRILPVWLFGEINRLRNDTLHGNPMNENRLVVPPGKRSINLYAAPLYRMALAAAVDLKHQPGPRSPDATDYENAWSDEFKFNKYQRDIEAALATILFTHEEYRERRATERRRNAARMSHQNG